jgi:dipeptidyl aminopeptidase/acylaminoacyl peptidase
VQPPGDEATAVVGGPGESVFQPEWSPSGSLHFASDRSGWWNLYRRDGDGIIPVLEVEADVGTPAWMFRYRRYGFLADGTILAVATSGEGTRLLRVDPGGGTRDLDPPGTWMPPQMALGPDAAYMVVGSGDRAPGVYRIDGTGRAAQVAPPPDPGVDPAYFSVLQRITFDTPDGPAYANFYPPANPDFAGPEGTAPPLVVWSHGGPTSSALTYLNLGIQFWTSRGFAIVDVDYGGSSGYGRDYRQRLDGRWGIVDVRDCALAARHLVAEGEADGEKLAIRGGSAGGYTTLAVLAFRDDFAAGASYFGVGDLLLLAEHTHKFESRYMDRLVGPLPEARAIYDERSPLRHVDGITCPVILFQGLDDRVVPPEQATIMAETLRSKGIPVAHIEFAGEGHGFRKAENVIRALEAELSFYGRVLGFDPPGIEPVAVENL